MGSEVAQPESDSLGIIVIKSCIANTKVAITSRFFRLSTRRASGSMTMMPSRA